MLLGAIGATAQGDRVDKAVLKTQQDVATALADLNQQRTQIEAARAPLAAEHDALSRRVQEKRIALEQKLEAQQYGEQQRRALAADVAGLEEECQFVLIALSEYRRAMETRASQAELQGQRNALAACDTLLTDAKAFSRLPDAAGSLLPLATDWNRIRIGGYQAPGTALNAAGIEEHGRFVFIGPNVYFVEASGVGGIVQTPFGSLNPTTYSNHSQQEQENIAALLSEAQSVVPLDVSGGHALKIEAAGDSLSEHVRKGGFVMLPLLSIGLLALVFTGLKVIELRGMRFASTESLAGVIQHLGPGETAQAVEAARALHPPLSTLIEEALTYRDAPREHIEEILHERILAMVPRLERHLGTLAVFGAIAPLLGLLGTVTGMIHTFDLVTLFGTGEARLLSGGISEALITTKFGLAIAIPVLLVHAFLSRRVRTIVGALENSAIRFVNALKIGTATP